MTDDFSKWPVSLSERRALALEDAHKWSPRDVLIHLLRQVDAGEISPSTLIVGFIDQRSDGPQCRTTMAVANNIEQAAVRHEMMIG